MTRARAAGIRQVAARAGVSIGTVSNVLNRPDVVAAATRAAVLAAIDELGFVRNGSASRLRAAQSTLVGLVVLDVGNPFFTAVVRGAEEVLEANGYTAIVCNTGGSSHRQGRHLRFLQEQRVAGALITPVDDASMDSAMTQLRERGVSAVLVDAPARTGGECAVTVDDVMGGHLAGEHLLATGRSRIVYVSGPQSIRQCADRGRGLRRALAAPIKSGAAHLDVVRIPALTGRDGHAATGRVLSLEPDAVFCANDVIALGLMRGLLEAGRAVPDDIALIGYDDIEYAQLAAAPLTSIAQPAEELGRQAARLLLDECDAESGHVHQQITFAPELVVRRSTDKGITKGRH